MCLDYHITELIERVITEKFSNFKTEIKSEIEHSYSPNLTRKEASLYLGLCLTTIDNYVKEGRLKKYKAGRKTYFKKSDLDNLPI